MTYGQHPNGVHSKMIDVGIAHCCCSFALFLSMKEEIEQESKRKEDDISGVEGKC